MKRGRPSEAPAAVTQALRVRVTPEERAALAALAARQGRPVSALLRRAIREIISGGPDFFDDGVAALANLTWQLSRIERQLSRLAGLPGARDLTELEGLIASTRAGFAEQVRRSRQRWAPATASLPDRRSPPTQQG